MRSWRQNFINHQRRYSHVLELPSGRFVLAEGLEGVVQAGFDCAEWDVQRISDILQGHVVYEAHEQRLALPYGSPLNDTGKRVRDFTLWMCVELNRLIMCYAMCRGCLAATRRGARFRSWSSVIMS